MNFNEGGMRIAILAGAFGLVLLLGQGATAQTALPPLWVGVQGEHATSWTLHPGERTRGDLLFDAPLTYARTGVLATDYILRVRGLDLRIPANTPLIAKKFFFVEPPATRIPDPRISARGTHYWCALPEPNGFVCFNYTASGQVYVYPSNFGDGPIHDRAPFDGSALPTPAPDIVEQAVDVPNEGHHIEYRLADFNDEGFILSTIGRYGTDAQAPFLSERQAWGEYRGAGYARDIVMTITPILGADGAIRAAQVRFAP